MTNVEDRAGIGWFDRVKVRVTPATEAAGIAGRVGSVYGMTTPSIGYVTDEIVGEVIDDVAIAVHVDDLGRTVWVARDLVEFLERPDDISAIVGDALEQDAQGRWVPARQKPGRFGWLRRRR